MLGTVRVTAKSSKILLRYPGGKQRQLPKFIKYLPCREKIEGRYFEPFFGGGSVFFLVRPRKSIVSDVNPELINLYKGLCHYPEKVWEIFQDFPGTKKDYYTIRSWNNDDLDIPTQAARTLFLNRTCFKGMWRHNSSGEFNVGYGGQSRRWVIDKADILETSNILKGATIECNDYQRVIEKSMQGDFIFLDPPYKPGCKEMFHRHYLFGTFSYDEQVRLSDVLAGVDRKGAKWAMTNSSHPDIVRLYDKFRIIPLSKGTGDKIGKITNSSGEVLILNY